MSIVQFNKVYKQFSGDYILKDINFTIEEKDKIGLIGLNGAGKTTLIKMILGEENVDGIENNINEKGDIFINKNKTIGYLSQNHEFISEKNTVYEEMLSLFHDEFNLYNELQNINISITELNDSDINYEKKFNELISKMSELSTMYEVKGGYEIEYKIKQVLTGLEIDETYYNTVISDLSGGEKTRISLAKLLLNNVDLLILDEPTNHLDIISIEWLEEYLKKYNKSFLLISHDRIFLDNVCNKIFEIENKKIYKYNGNFSSFILQKEMILKGEIKRYEKEQEKIKKMEEYIERFRAGIKSKQARGRQKILDRIERMEDPIFNPQRMRLKFEIDNFTGDNVLKVNNISKKFGKKQILNNINFQLYKGDRVGIIGKNGIGKSTLLKILTNRVKADEGTIEFGSRVKIGYYDQDQSELYSNNTILEEINTSLNNSEEYLRSLAGSFLFSGEDVNKKINMLSGGEKVRISLLKLYMEKANLLILDEPTNHLDIYSIEVLEEALEHYEGSMLIISHNRHFLDSVCNVIYFLDENGLTKFKGSYSDYKKALKINKNKPQELQEEKELNKLSYQEQKDKKNKISKLKRDIEKIELEIEKIASEKKELEKKYQLAGVENNIDELIKLQENITILDKQENDMMNLWEALNEELLILK